MFNRAHANTLVGGRVSEERMTLIGRALVFALGMALLLSSVYSVVMSAAYLIAYAPQYFDTSFISSVRPLVEQLLAGLEVC
jgi:hypothetical protein